jgi:hypothetical protein
MLLARTFLAMSRTSSYKANIHTNHHHHVSSTTMHRAMHLLLQNVSCSQTENEGLQGA